jgi:hypothetical protein
MHITRTILALTLLTPLACQQKQKERAGESTAKEGKPAAPATPAVDPEDAVYDALEQKLDAYIECGNRFDAQVYSSRNIYLYEVDPKKGPGARSEPSLHEVTGTAECVDAIVKVKALKPAQPELEQAADAYAVALTKVEAVTRLGHDYYEQKDYQDDKMAKGKELHPQLMAAYDEFAEAEHRFSALVTAKNEAVQERTLARVEKAEGRSAHALRIRLMMTARKMVDVAAVPIAKVDHEKLSVIAAEFEKVVTELEDALAKDQAKASAYRGFVDGAKAYLKEAKALARRVRDKVPFTTGERNTIAADNEEAVDGTPRRTLRAFNDLVDRSNDVREP